MSPEQPRRTRDDALRLAVANRWAAAAWVLWTASAVMAVDPTLLPRGGSPAATPPPPAEPTEIPAANPAAGAAAQSGSVRPPVPDAAALQQAGKLIDDVYREQLVAARSPEQRKALGQKLLSDAVATTDDAAGRYALLLRARDLAGDAGDVDTALAALAALEREYAVDPGSFDSETVVRLQRSLRGPEVHRLLARHLLGSANEAVGADRFEIAKRNIDLAAGLAGKANDPLLARTIVARAKDIRDIETAYTAAKPALAAVEKGGTDPAQCLTAGRYLALYKADFAKGMPLLATGSDATLKDLAVKELGAAGADQQLALADAWFDLAEKNQGVPRSLATLRAKYWYDQAEPGLAGLAKAKAAKRSKDADALSLSFASRPSSGSSAMASGPGGGSTTSSPPSVTPNPSPSPTPSPNSSPNPPAAAGPLPFRLPGKFTREWRSPEVWAGKPESVVVNGNRVTITNENGANTVCENEPLVPNKDGTVSLTWDYGPDKAGAEVWFIKGNELIIHRWKSKADKDSGVPARRIGFAASK